MRTALKTRKVEYINFIIGPQLGSVRVSPVSQILSRIHRMGNHGLFRWMFDMNHSDNIQIASPAGIWAGKPSLPGPSPSGQSTGFDRDCYRIWAGPGRASPDCPLEPVWIPPGACIRDMHGPWADSGPAWLGPGQESTGLALARTNPMVPVVARMNPAWDQSGLAIWVESLNYDSSMHTGEWQTH